VLQQDAAAASNCSRLHPKTLCIRPEFFLIKDLYSDQEQKVELTGVYFVQKRNTSIIQV
jgi:hypothetical protein